MCKIDRILIWSMTLNLTKRNIIKVYDNMFNKDVAQISPIRGLATNSGLLGVRGQFQIGLFLYRKYNRGIKDSNVSSMC